VNVTRIFIIVFLFFMFLFPLFSLANTDTEVSSEEGNFQAESGDFPLSVTDFLGRTVIIETLPERIISLTPSITETLFAVDAGEQVIGVTTFCNFPPEAEKKEVIGVYAGKTVSIEKILYLQPDIVFTGGEYHRPLIESLESYHITVFAVDINDFNDLYFFLITAGRMTGHLERAQTLLEYIKGLEEKITEAVQNIPSGERLKAFYEVWDEPLMTCSGKSFIGKIIQKAGGINIFQEVQVEYPLINAEDVILNNPDVILGPSDHSSVLVIEQIAGRSGWESINAVINNRIIILDGDIISRPGPRMINALGLVFKALYPDHFYRLFQTDDPLDW
jgi:iron complex transport system substrate-binding protein